MPRYTKQYRMTVVLFPEDKRMLDTIMTEAKKNKALLYPDIDSGPDKQHRYFGHITKGRLIRALIRQSYRRLIDEKEN